MQEITYSLAVVVEVAEERATRAGEREHRQRDGNRNIDANLTYKDDEENVSISNNS